MIKNVNDICLLTEKLNKFRKTVGIKKQILFTLIERPGTLKIWHVEYDEIYDLCKSLNLLEEKDGRVVLSRQGESLIDIQSNSTYLNYEQKRYLFEKCLLGNQNFKNELDFLKLFTYDANLQTFVLNEKNFPIKSSVRLYLLSGLNVINKINNSTWAIELNHLQDVEILGVNEPRKISQKQLDEIHEEQKEIGNIAEELTLKFEIKRLQALKLIEESKNIQLISKSHVNRGYDIESFSSKSIRPNLFIEVKGRKRLDTSIFISANEIKMAKKLKDRYAIYFWNNLGSPNLPEKPFKIIINPYLKLKIKECEGCIQYLIDLGR